MAIINGILTKECTFVVSPWDARGQRMLVFSFRHLHVGGDGDGRYIYNARVQA